MAARVRRLGASAAPIGALAGCLICIWFGLVTLALTLPAVLEWFPATPYALDGHRSLIVASVVAGGGNPYAVSGFFYSPLGAAAMIPLAALGVEAGVWAWFALKLGLLVWCVADATRDRPWAVRALAGAYVITWTFVLDDLWLGNVSIAMAAAIYLAVSRDRPWAAIPLGLVIAAVAKPLLLPLLAWLIVFRRRSAATALGTAAAATVLGGLFLGPISYRSYVGALSAAANLDSTGSLGLSGFAPQLLLPASMAALVVFAVLLWRSRDESSLLMWSLLIGLVAAPYVASYSVVPVLAGIPALARAHPSRALLMAAVAAPVSLLAIMGATLLGLVITFPSDVLRRRRPGRPAPRQARI